MKKLLTIGALVLGLSTLGFAKDVAPKPIVAEEETVKLIDKEEIKEEVKEFASKFQWPEQTNVYTRVGLGYGIYDQVKADGDKLNDRGTRDVAKEISVEVTKEIYPQFELGVGMAVQKHGEPGDRNSEGFNVQLPSYTSVPLYVTGKYNFKVTETGWKPYAKADLGISINDNDDDIKLRNFESYDIYTRMSNGVYASLGVGAEKNNITLDIAYKFNQADIKVDGYKDDYNSHRIMMSVGYRFDI